MQVVVPEHLCFVLPDGVSMEEGALCEPLSVAIHACRRAAGIKASHTLTPTSTRTPTLTAALTSPQDRLDSGPSTEHKSHRGVTGAAGRPTSHTATLESSLEPSPAPSLTPAPAPDLPPPCLSGQSVAVLGAGPIGLLCAVTAVAFGAASVVLCDVSPERVGFARQHLPMRGGEGEGEGEGEGQGEGGDGGSSRIRVLQLERNSTVSRKFYTWDRCS